MKAAFLFGLVAVALASGCRSSAPCPHCSESPDAESGAVTTASAASTDSFSRLDSFEFTTHEGKRLRFSDLKGAPSAVSFIYTRCQNQRKCPLVARTMAQLQSDLDRAGIQPRPNLALITYDPEYDTPARLKEFGAPFGLTSSTNTLLLRPDPAAKLDLFEELKVAVNFNAGGVNLHGIQLLLFDKAGRPAQAYRGLIWDNSKVIADLQALSEQTAP